MISYAHEPIRTFKFSRITYFLVFEFFFVAKSDAVKPEGVIVCVLPKQIYQVTLSLVYTKNEISIIIGLRSYKTMQSKVILQMC